MRKLRVLVVDDEELMREMTAVILNHHGHTVTVAKDGAEAWDIFMFRPDQEYDLVITDLQMPRISGIELAACIAENFPSSRTVKLILTTAGDMVETLERGPLPPGVDAFIAKPFRTERLMAVVHKLFPWT